MKQSVSGSQLPRVRTDLEFIPITHEQQQLVLVRDHLGLVAEGQALPGYAFGLLKVLNSSRDADTLRQAMAQITQGRLITQAEVLSFLNELDAAYLLDTPHFAEAYSALVDQFTSASVRPCALCGRAYPDATNELSAWIESIFTEQDQKEDRTMIPKALIAPHIDPPVGARVYANAYAQIRHARPERVLVLGVGHQLVEGMFCLTEKSFATPLGTVATDGDTVARVREAGKHFPGLMAANDFCHRSEHSIEFQILFLQHLLPEGSFSIIPVLCGSPHLHLREYSRRAFKQHCEPVLEVLAALAQDPQTLVVTGVDLSHIGLKFGHEQPAKELEAETRTHDTALLDSLAAGNAKGFWEESARVNDRYNVCGFSALATLLEILPGATGRCLDYGLWHEEPTQSGVSFAAMVLSDHS